MGGGFLHLMNRGTGGGEEDEASTVLKKTNLLFIYCEKETRDWKKEKTKGHEAQGRTESGKLGGKLVTEGEVQGRRGRKGRGHSETLRRTT